jgi:hypothetical protein
MPWFKVDDSFHAHPKVLATDPAALGLWVVAGAWSSAHLTEGRVPDQVLPRLLPDSETLARTLVAAGLWRKVRGGYQFHDWTDYNPTRKEIEADRKAARERMKRLRTQRKQAGQNQKGSAEHQANVRPMFVTPTRPLPSTKEGRGGGAQSTREPQCPKHRGQPADNCALCRSERLEAT